MFLFGVLYRESTLTTIYIYGAFSGRGGRGEKISLRVFVCWQVFFFWNMLHKWYPVSSWFLLRQTRDKPLQATVCFSINHAWVCHAPHDTFDVNFICQFIVYLKCLYKRMQISCQKCWQKNNIHIKPKLTRLSCLLLCEFAELVEHNTPDLPPHNNLIQYNWQQVCKSSFKRLDIIKIKNRSVLKALEEECQGCTACIGLPEESRNIFLHFPSGLWPLHGGFT